MAAAAAVDEAAFELSKFGLAELMRKDQTRCKFHVNGKKKKVYKVRNTYIFNLYIY